MCDGIATPVVIVWDTHGDPHTGGADAAGVGTVEFDLGPDDDGYLAANVRCGTRYMRFAVSLVGQPAAATAVFTSIKLNDREMLFDDAWICRDPYAPRLEDGSMPIRPMIPLVESIWRSCPAT